MSDTELAEHDTDVPHHMVMRFPVRSAISSEDIVSVPAAPAAEEHEGKGRD